MYQINPDRVAEALASETLKCTFCNLFKQKVSINPKERSFMGVMATLCIFMTSVVSTDFELPAEATLKSVKKLVEDLLNSLTTPRNSPDDEQNKYIITLVSKVLDSALACKGDNEPK